MATASRKVIAGPAGHWYAVMCDVPEGDAHPVGRTRYYLLGWPMDADGGTHDRNNPPEHPEVSGDTWVEITDPGPEVDALIAELIAA